MPRLRDPMWKKTRHAWYAAIRRCHNPKDINYENYGARGITMYEEWRNDFNKFLAHIGKCPGGLFSLDRIDNNKGYFPGNVRWATRHEQATNKRYPKGKAAKYDISPTARK